jgi:hypothetical protein
MSEDNIYAALARAAKHFEPVLKNRTNPHFKSKYADLDAVLAAVRPALLEEDISIVSSVVTSDSGTQSLMTRLVHATGSECVVAHVPLLLDKQTMQGLGSAITYARRYALGMLLGIAPEEDDDGNSATPARQDPPAVVEAKQRADAILARVQESIGEGVDSWLVSHVLTLPPAVKHALFSRLNAEQRQYLVDLKKQQESGT